MRKSLAIGGALLALFVFASTADARMMGGGGGMSMSPSMSHSAPVSSMLSPSMGSPRTFSPDGFTTKVKGANWKKPIDSDGGGPADPQPKPPKTQTSDGDGSSGHFPHGGFYPPHRHGGGYYGGYHGGYHPDPSGEGNVPQRTCKGGC